jgi:hypothetical protein
MTDQSARHRFIAADAGKGDVGPVIGRILFSICASIMALHIVSVVMNGVVDPKAGAFNDVLALLNAAQERSLAGWWTSALLMTCCLAALGASRLAGAFTSRRAAWPWLVLAMVFALLSLDEVVSLHERGAKWTAAVLDSDSPLARLGWTIPATAILLASLAVLIPAMRAIPVRARALVLIGLGTSIAGALGMEVVNVVLTQAGARYLWRLIAMAIEETAEMVGVVVVLLGVLTAVRIRWAGRQLTVAYTDDRLPR